jgi:membrane protease YdiL (CAAX protease family)
MYETLLIVIPIIVLTLISGADLGSIFIKLGNQNYKWGFGVGGLVLVNFFTSVLIFFGTGYELPKLGSAIVWGFVFSICNAFSEELWIRGLFMKKMFPIIGIAGTVLLTSTTFAIFHLTSVAYLPAIAVPVFLINTFTLGLACGILMQKTDSIWGAYLIHMAADIFLFIATLAAR